MKRGHSVCGMVLFLRWMGHLPYILTEYKANPTGQAMKNGCLKGGIRDVDVVKTSYADCIFADRRGVMYEWLWNVPEGANP